MKFFPPLLIILGIGCAEPKCEPPKPYEGKFDFEFTSVNLIATPKNFPYPKEAQSSGIEGVVRVRLKVDTSGIPISAQAIGGPIQLFKFAESYFLACRYCPAVLNGVPQITEPEYKIKFSNKSESIELVQ